MALVYLRVPSRSAEHGCAPGVPSALIGNRGTGVLARGRYGVSGTTVSVQEVSEPVFLLLTVSVMRSVQVPLMLAPI